MKSFTLAAVVACLLAGTALGAVTIDYTLQLGGNNNEPDYEAGNNPAYTPGTDTEFRVIDEAVDEINVITWDTKVVVDGTYDAGGTVGVIPSNGLANMVFSLELYNVTDLENAVDFDVFFSTMNDGDGLPGPVADPLEMAAFCHIYNIDGAGPPGGTAAGRIFDGNSSGGPGLKRAQYASTVSHAGGRNIDGWLAPGGTGVSTVDVGGKLVGMGAGYTEFKTPTSGGTTTAGVGIYPYAWTSYCGRGLGHVPVCEGQIDLSALPAGTYQLKLVPGAGNNFLRGDFDCTYGQIASFARAPAAEDVAGDTIEFQWIPSGPTDCPAIVSWTSLRTHATAGELGISTAGGPGAQILETRAGGIRKIQIDFAADASGAWTSDADIVITKVADNYTGELTGDPPPPGACAAVVADSAVWTNEGKTLTFDLDTTGTHSVVCVIDLTDAFTCTLADGTCAFRMCYGNINFDLVTNLADMAKAKLNNNQPLVPDQDVNVDGTLNLADMAACKLANGKVQCPAVP